MQKWQELGFKNYWYYAKVFRPSVIIKANRSVRKYQKNPLNKQRIRKKMKEYNQTEHRKDYMRKYMIQYRKDHPEYVNKQRVEAYERYKQNKDLK